jgi:mannose/fructose-specific phosphotransferase system component IIA
MAKILVVSHGLLAQGLCDAVAMIMGTGNAPDYISLDAMQGVEQLEKELNEKICDLLNTCNKLLVVCDLYFGCPFITASKCVAGAFPAQQFRIVAGANLPMLLELCLANETTPDDLDHLVEVALSKGKEGIMEFVPKPEASVSDEAI